MLGRRWRDDVELSGLGGQRRLVEVVEVGVLEGVPRRDPPRRVVLQHLLQQVDADRVQLQITSPVTMDHRISPLYLEK